MAEQNYDIPSSPTYDMRIRKIQNTDPVNADRILNPVLQQMINNIHATKQLAESKVNQVDGMGLSENSYTIAEKTKLEGIAESANNYVHPAAHPASMITTDDDHCFVTKAVLDALLQRGRILVLSSQQDIDKMQPNDVGFVLDTGFTAANITNLTYSSTAPPSGSNWAQTVQTISGDLEITDKLSAVKNKKFAGKKEI